MLNQQDVKTLEGVGRLDEFIAAAAHYIRHHPVNDASPVAAAMSRDEADLFRALGGRGLDADDSKLASARRSNVMVLAAEYAQMVAGAKSIAEVTEYLGVKPSRVRQRVVSRSLYAIDGPNGRVFPRFQFTESGVLPGLSKVLDAIDDDAHPVAVERFFLTPTEDLESELTGEPVAPRDWLLAGLPVGPVAELARAP